MQTPKWIDPKVTAGNILIAVTMAASVFAAYSELQQTDVELSLRVQNLEREDDRRRQFETEVRITLGQIRQDLAVLKDARERDRDYYPSE